MFYKNSTHLVSCNLPFQFHVSIIRSKPCNIWTSSTVYVLFPAAWLQVVVCCCSQCKADTTMMINRPSSDPGQQNEQFLVQLFAWVVVPSCTFQRASKKPHLKWIEKTKHVDQNISAILYKLNYTCNLLIIKNTLPYISYTPYWDILFFTALLMFVH